MRVAPDFGGASGSFPRSNPCPGGPHVARRSSTNSAGSPAFFAGGPISDHFGIGFFFDSARRRARP